MIKEDESIKTLPKFPLSDFYSKEEINAIKNAIKKAFEARSIVQYYANKFVTKEDSDFIMAFAPLFISKSKEILIKLNEEDIKKLRKKIKMFL